MGGRIKLLVTSFGSAGLWPLAALMLALVVFVGFVISLPWIVEELELTELRAAVDQVGALVAVVLGFVAWLGPHLTFINHKLRPLFDAYGRVVDKEKQAHAQREAESAVMEQELQKLRARQTEQERIVAEQEAERVSLEALASGERPNELLARFIEDRARGEGYRKHLGLVSLVRRDFQAMSDLMRDLRKEREAEAAGRNERKTDHTTIELPPIDRIVLYVDDLDRCRHEQVVDMLEAVHLLLAFDLFVVVVGVDERWLRQSLRRAYPGQLANKHDGREPRASPADYLAKIFQIPIWIRPLSFGKQGNYPDLLSDLIGDEVVITKDRIDQEPGDIQQLAAVQRSDDRGNSAQLTPIDITIPPRMPASEETRDLVTISDKEFELMTKLSPLIELSPRAVKRFVNLYRLYRAGLSGEERAQLVDDSSPRYLFVMFWLAAETGLDDEHMTLLSGNLRG